MRREVSRIDGSHFGDSEWLKPPSPPPTGQRYSTPASAHFLPRPLGIEVEFWNRPLHTPSRGRCEATRKDGSHFEDLKWLKLPSPPPPPPPHRLKATAHHWLRRWKKIIWDFLDECNKEWRKKRWRKINLRPFGQEYNQKWRKKRWRKNDLWHIGLEYNQEWRKKMGRKNDLRPFGRV